MNDYTIYDATEQREYNLSALSISEATKQIKHKLKRKGKKRKHTIIVYVPFKCAHVFNLYL